MTHSDHQYRQETDGDSRAIRYAWASITKGTRNFGNHLIEWSLSQLLDLPPPAIVFDSFRAASPSLVKEINESCAFVINPGCTTLQSGANPAFDAFEAVVRPKPCFGGCVWQMGTTAKWKLALRAIGPASLSATAKRDSTAPDTSIARKMSPPVGTRDPFTHAALQAAGIESQLIGCPTAISPIPVSGWKQPTGRNLVVSLGRFGLPMQLRILGRLRSRWDVSVLVHESYELRFLHLLRGIRVVRYQNVEQFFGHYRDADVVLTGRLHGVLPAVRFGTPVVFFGDPADTRFSILAFLTLPIRRLDMDLVNLESLPEIKEPSPVVHEKVAELRRSFSEYCGKYGIRTTLAT